MSRTIAIGDIHGCSIALEALLEAISPQPPFRLEEEMEEMGESLGAGQVLLGNVQKEASHRTVIQENRLVMFLDHRRIPPEDRVRPTGCVNSFKSRI